MAILLSRATGNLTDAATWALVDSTSYFNSETSGAFLSSTESTNRAAVGFTPGAITIDAIAVKISAKATSATGTFSCQLWNLTDTAAVAGTSVTVNVADIQSGTLSALEGGWFLLKFAAPVTLIAGKSYVVSPVNSVSSQVSLCRDATANNWSRCLRTTTTQAPVAGDDLIVAGEHTGAGTGNDITVTNNQTVNTDYGSNTTSTVTPAIAVCKRGTLKWADTSAANPYLRLSGYLIVYNGGAFNIGTTGTPIPRDSVALLEFDCTADGDFGLIARNGSTVTMQGQSRTSGKNVVACKLAADTARNLAIVTQNFGLATPVALPSTLDPTGTTLGGASISMGSFNPVIGVSDSAASGNHRVYWTQSASLANTTQVFTAWVKRGSGTNNRYIRLQLATVNTTPPVNGFYADFDLQAGTAGTVTVAGDGTATSAAIVAYSGGFICTIIGRASASATTPVAAIFSANASGGVTYTGDATQCFICTWAQVYTASAQPTDLTVDTDTGWLAGDVVAIASTTRSTNECEVVQLGSNATSTTLPLSLYPTYYHDGLSPVQAEVILLTRNVKVRGVSPTAMSFMHCPVGSSVDVDWAEFSYMGENAGGKRGVEIEIGTGSTNVNMQFSSLHDFEDFGFYVQGGATTGVLTNLVFSNNTMWNLAITAGPAGQITAAINSTNWTIDSNVLIRTGVGNGWTLADIGGTFTNNTVVGAASLGISLAEQYWLGTFNGNTAHSNTSAGISAGNVIYGGLIQACSAWRNNSSGFATSSGSTIVLDTFTAFGNNTNNMTFPAGSYILRSVTANGDTTFSTFSGINITGALRLIIENSDFSTVSGIKTAHTQDIQIGSLGIAPNILLRNTKLGATEVNQQYFLQPDGYVSSQKHDQTAGSHKTWMRSGTVQTDVTVYRTAAPSMRMALASSASNPIALTCAITSGNAVFTVANSSLSIMPAVEVGMLLVNSSYFPMATTVAAIDRAAGTITASANAFASAASVNVDFMLKLPSAPPGRGLLVAVNNGSAVTVSCYVRKQQENLLTYSEDFSNAAWTLLSSTQTTGQTDPLGGTSAFQFLETTANTATHGVGRASATTLNTGATYTLSAYVKGGGRQWLRIIESAQSSWFDVTNGVTGTANAAHTTAITSVGSGWYRISVAFVASAPSNSPSIVTATADNNSVNFAGDVTKGFLSWGWQLETGSTGSSYHKTTTTTQPGYNGQQPRLIQRANPALGQNNDVVLDTMSGGYGVWEQLSGTTSSPTDDGAWEIIVDCDGTQGWINIDDFAVY